MTPTSNAFFKIGSQLTAGQVEEVITVSIQGQRMGTIVLKAAKKQEFLTIQIQQPGNFEVELTVYTYMADGKGVFGTSKALVNVKGGESFWVTALGASTDGVSTVYGLQKAE